MKRFYKSKCILPLISVIIGNNNAANAKSGSKDVEQDKRPNILFFITDDESWVERSAYGWSNLPTPNFDRVAEQGVLFTNAFTSAPSSAPSRASILTGHNFWELEQGAFIQAFLPKKFPIFTNILEENGYRVGHTHKTWGPGNFLKEGHSRVSGIGYNDMKVEQLIDGITPNDYAANFEAFLKDNKSDQPFFFWAGVFEPHLPNGEGNYKRLEKELGISLDQIKLFPGTDDTPKNRQDRANYIYEIYYADQHLGRMLESLEKYGELENTLVVVTSDNGTPVTRGNELVGKASGYDLGVHIPLAIMWPTQIKSGRKVVDFVSFADFAPTFLELAAVNASESMTGNSLLPLLISEKSGQIDSKRKFIVTGLEWHGESDPVSRSSRTIRDNRYAYIVRYNNVDGNGQILQGKAATKPAKIEFYDMVKDPWQLNDLSNNSKYAREKKRLSKKLSEYGMKTNDPRVTGEMEIFIKTRKYVQKRREIGYRETMMLPFIE